MEEPRRLAWWPSAVAVQAEAANHPELLRSRAVVVSVAGMVAPQSAAGVDHEGERKQTTDDVSKNTEWHQNRGLFVAPGRVWGAPADCPDGARHGGGASVVRALARNVGTCRPAPAGGQWRGLWPTAVGGSETPKRLKPRGAE
jgi:hypothetical protein